MRNRNIQEVQQGLRSKRLSEQATINPHMKLDGFRSLDVAFGFSGFVSIRQGSPYCWRIESDIAEMATNMGYINGECVSFLDSLLSGISFLSDLRQEFIWEQIDPDMICKRKAMLL